MKQKSIISLAVILAIAGAISYAIIWFRKKQAATVVTAPATDATKSTVVDSKTGYVLPKIETYGWWINKIGHAKFPLGMNSKGVEVLKVQEGLNSLTTTKRLNASPIGVDGVWGFETDARFKILFSGNNLVTQYQFITDFDPNGDIPLL